jgi:hypothetical protein
MDLTFMAAASTAAFIISQLAVAALTVTVTCGSRII